MLGAEGIHLAAECALAITKLAGEAALDREIVRVRVARNEGIARAIFVGELDKEHSSFESALKGIQETLGIKPAVTSIPIGREASL